MRRALSLIVAGCGALVLLVPGTPADGAVGNPPPVILAAIWVTAPVDAGQTEVLQVSAFDPSGVIKEIAVDWGDGDLSFAGLICSQGVATTRIDHQFRAAGVYVVRIVATSAGRCSSAASQQSAPFLLPTRAN